MAGLEAAVSYAMTRIGYSTDWQQVQADLADHDEIRAWLDEQGDPVAACEGVIRMAEQRLGDDLPAGYSN